MKTHASTQPMAWMRRLLRLLALLVVVTTVPSLSPGSVLGRRRLLVVDSPVSVPYLRAMGSPPLRFQEEPPPRPPRPVPTPAAPEPLAGRDTEPAPPDTSALPATPPEPDATHGVSSTSPAPTPEPILPDETRPKVRAEDFLPFFQFPARGGSAGDVTIIAPVPPAPSVPSHALPSSATYRQQ
ncbi:MAG: hypothetical protein JNG83_07100 [Opitutaceae bacterium]|nr:hypothetical protein [Opitutaceae bacterium]